MTLLLRLILRILRILRVLLLLLLFLHLHLQNSHLGIQYADLVLLQTLINSMHRW